MDQELQRIEQRLAVIEEKVDAAYRSSERMRKYFLWGLIISIVVIAIPLILLPLVLPSFLQSVTIPAGL